MEVKTCSHCNRKIFRGKFFEVDSNTIPVFLHLTCIEDYKKEVNANLGKEVEFKEVLDLKWNHILKAYH